MAYKNHRDLLMWQKAIELADTVHRYCMNFPKQEIFGLVSQMDRCAVSIASNIAEGKGRDNLKEFDHFLRISLGSAWELDTQIEISFRRGYINTEEKDILLVKLEEVQKLIYGMRKSIHQRLNPES